MVADKFDSTEAQWPFDSRSTDTRLRDERSTAHTQRTQLHTALAISRTPLLTGAYLEQSNMLIC